MPNTFETEADFINFVRRFAIGTKVSIHVPGFESPIVLRANTSDCAVFRQIFIRQELAFPVDRAPHVIIDAGANIGLATLYFAARYPKCKIVSLEVDAQNYQLLKLNTQCLPNVICRLQGLWSHQTRLSIANPNAQPWAFRVVEARNCDTRSIEAIGVMDILQEYSFSRIGLLKIDIEGAELEVFSKDTSEWPGLVDNIAIELHDRFQHGCSPSVHSALFPWGFEISRHGEYTLFRRRNL